MKCVVIGSGPTALAAALRLRQNGLEVVLIKEGSEPFNDRYGETVTEEILEFLDSFGLLESFFDLKMSSIEDKITSWVSNDITNARSVINPMGFGWHIDRTKFLNLFNSVLSNYNVKIIQGQVLDIENENTRLKLNYQVYERHEALFCDFAVIATGRKKPKFIKLPNANYLDRLVAVNVIATDISDSAKLKDSILIDAHENGWFYSIGLTTRERLFTFYTDGDLLINKIQISFIDFLKGQMAFLPVMGEFYKHLAKSKIGHYSVVPASSYFRPSLENHKILIAGDLAQTYDPISSSGIVKAIKDGIDVANLILAFDNDISTTLKNRELKRRKEYLTYIKLRYNLYFSNQRFLDSRFWKRRRDFSELEQFVRMNR